MLLEVKRTKLEAKRKSPLECRLLEAKRTCP